MAGAGRAGFRQPAEIGPHVFRHTTAVHLLEAGVEVNVIRGWLGHVNLARTNRYADINLRTKEAALQGSKQLALTHSHRLSCGLYAHA